MNDTIADAGAQAWHDGKSHEHCPYVDTYESGDYWASPAGLRQRWMRGYNLTAHNNEIMSSRSRWPFTPAWSPE